MNTDPPAPDLGAQDPRFQVEDILQHVSLWDEQRDGLETFIAAYDAQAARLVAVEPVADAARAWWGSRGHPFEAESMAELERVVAVYCESGAWQKASGAVGAGEARDG